MDKKERIIQRAAELSVRITENILKHLDEFEEDRKKMIEIIESRGVKDQRVLFAMNIIPRHIFVPSKYVPFAYEDSPLEIGLGQTISQPYITAFMTEHLEISESNKVLEIGTGSGYHTAILSMLCSKVITVEYEKSLSEKAKKILDYLGLSDNMVFVVGDGSTGFEEQAPYDRICVSSATPDVPPPLIEQLKEKGIMIIPTGDPEEQILCKIIKETNGKGFTKQELCGCRFVKMKGKYGFKD
ncbi:MAG: protein-L-isoaspartate(D-aspartate) O-methyltransferase [Candidatus Calescibacterium sp.]|nr:protein-L-isoaspartate(D-aspartate) O-methyltransferase [Candidatus Calescibacterium sp.]MCX7734688.1 protein-L-isoaspartate(D-aspartate) O-methyltransferase [bacterium]MDW8087576.1 protein-L-isoaspartate(D-aspartate) O-methyltransferase [Candidatus Calescibacterium sp.]